MDSPCLSSSSYIYVYVLWVWGRYNMPPRLREVRMMRRSWPASASFSSGIRLWIFMAVCLRSASLHYPPDPPSRLFASSALVLSCSATYGLYWLRLMYLWILSSSVWVYICHANSSSFTCSLHLLIRTRQRPVNQYATPRFAYLTDSTPSLGKLCSFSFRNKNYI